MVLTISYNNYVSTIGVPLFKMLLTNDFIQYVVCTSHSLRKCCLTSRYTKIRKQTKMTTNHHQNHVEDRSVLPHDVREISVMCIPFLGIGVGGVL